MNKLKLNVLLAKTEYSASVFKNLITDYVAFFKNHQAAFKGIRKTYTAREGTMDEPTKRGNTNIITTVAEKVEYLEKEAVAHINNLFSVEATNASGTAKVELVVDDISFGWLSSLELLRLKSMLDTTELDDMYKNVPVRSETENWSKSSDEQYTGRDVYELEMIKGVHKGVIKEPYILPDPNMTKDTVAAMARYTPQTVARDKVTEFGDYTVQQFSGESTHRERAGILARKSKLKGAVIEALKQCNEVEAVPSELTSEKLFGYLHRGKF